MSSLSISKRLLIGGWLLSGAFVATSAFPLASTPHKVVARVSVHAENEPVRSVLMRLAHDAGTNIAVSDNVSGYVTVRLRDVTIAEALDAILLPLGDLFHLHGNVYIVEPGSGGGPGAVAGGPAVLPLAVMPAKRAAALLRPLFPQASIRVDESANALVVIAPSSDVQTMRTVLQGTDVRNPTLPATDAVALHVVRGDTLAVHLRASFPTAKFSVAGEKQILVTAVPGDMTQIKAAIAALDAPTTAPSPIASSSEAVRVTQRAPRDVARALASQVPGLHASVSGSLVVLSGAPDVVGRAKALVPQLDLPNFGDRYTQVYRVRSINATSVADLLRRSFRDLDVTVDAELNALAVNGTAAQQQRIADAVAQLDPAPGLQNSANMPISGNGSTGVITLKSFVPGQTQGGIDAVAAMTQAIQVVASDVHVVQLPTPGQIALLGPPASVRAAREFIEKVDVVPPLVVLDTEVLEVDESVAKNLGLQLGTAAISTTFGEMTPPTNSDGSQARLGGFQALSRTPVQFTAQLNLLIQNGKGRVLADPRITTLSGRTASIRAGDTISILTTTAGNAGTIATTQVQSFQTGVTLDITPSVTPDGDVMVNLHPVVNSLIGTNNGVPEISTRDTQTTVHLHDDETLVIGGLIQENETRTTTKLPLVGDIPLVGRAFRNDNVQGQRNELVIVVTPHVVKPGSTAMPGPLPHAIPTPPALPTLPPNTKLPPATGQLPRNLGRLPIVDVPSPAQSSSPGPAPLSSSQTPAPSTVAQTKVFTFGSAPQSNFAKAMDPVQIFSATLSPIVVKNGTSVQVGAITTTNVATVKLIVGTTTISLGETGPGRWRGTFPYPGGSGGASANSLTLQMTASRSDGAASSIPIPVSFSP